MNGNLISLFILPSSIAGLQPSLPPQPVIPQHIICSISRPSQVVKVFPVEKAALRSVDSIGANFRFTPEKKAELGSFQLFVDGVNVTSQSRISGTRDDLPSRTRIAYTPNNFQPGIHQAEVRYHTVDGAQTCYRWSFQLKRS